MERQVQDLNLNASSLQLVPRTRIAALPVKKISLRIRLLPIGFFLAYLTITVVLFAYGPWPWPVRDGTKLYLFLTCAHIALALGYLSVIRRQPGRYSGKWKTQRIVVVSLIINLMLLIPTAISRTGTAVPDVVGGLSDPGLAYTDAAYLRSAGTPIVEYIRIIVAPFLFLLVPLTIYYWQSLKLVIRLAAAFAILAYLSIFVAIGTNKAIADFAILAPWLILGSYVSGHMKVKLVSKILATIILVIAFAFFLWFFTTGTTTRRGSGAVSGYFVQADIWADPNNPVVRDLPSDIRVGVNSLTSYLTQGYYALYLALDRPFLPTFGVGNSMFLYRNVARLFDIPDVESRPYPVQIQNDGWDAYRNWSSIYPWIASDVSFPGTIFVVFVIGRLFALSWLDILNGANPFAVAAFAEFATMIYYFPANNQVLQSGESLVAFWIILILWLRTRKKVQLT